MVGFASSKNAAFDVFPHVVVMAPISCCPVRRRRAGPVPAVCPADHDRALGTFQGTRSTGSVVSCTPISNLFTNRQRARIDAVSAVEDRTEVEIWAVDRRIVTAYRGKDCERVLGELSAVITSLRRGTLAVLAEPRRLGRTLNRRAADVLAYFTTLPDKQRPDRSGQRTASNTSEAPHSASATSTSPTTSPEHARDRRLQTSPKPRL